MREQVSLSPTRTLTSSIVHMFYPLLLAIKVGIEEERSQVQLMV